MMPPDSYSPPPPSKPAALPQGLQPTKVCPYCRITQIARDSLSCVSCLEKIRVARLDALTEKVATECMAQLTRFVVRGDMTIDEASSKAWDLGLAFTAEGVKRSNPK